jgi:hypothetical protein
MSVARMASRRPIKGAGMVATVSSGLFACHGSPYLGNRMGAPTASNCSHVNEAITILVLWRSLRSLQVQARKQWGQSQQADPAGRPADRPRSCSSSAAGAEASTADNCTAGTAHISTAAVCTQRLHRLEWESSRKSLTATSATALQGTQEGVSPSPVNGKCHMRPAAAGQHSADVRPPAVKASAAVMCILCSVYSDSKLQKISQAASCKAAASRGTVLDAEASYSGGQR